MQPRTHLLLFPALLFSFVLHGQDLDHIYPIYQVERNYFTLNPAAAGMQAGMGLTFSSTLELEQPGGYLKNVALFFDKQAKKKLGWGLAFEAMNGSRANDIVSIGSGLKASYFSFSPEIGNTQAIGFFRAKIGVLFQHKNSFVGLSVLFPGFQTHFPKEYQTSFFFNDPIRLESASSLLLGTKLKLGSNIDLKPILLYSGSQSFSITSSHGLQDELFHTGYLDIMAMLIWKEKNSLSANFGLARTKKLNGYPRPRLGCQISSGFGQMRFAASAGIEDGRFESIFYSFFLVQLSMSFRMK
jgi:hypothetical protein